MKSPDKPRSTLPSLADYLLRYDLKQMMEEARMDYTLSSTGAPRLLDQKDIAARFRKAATAPKPPTP